MFFVSACYLHFTGMPLHYNTMENISVLIDRVPVLLTPPGSVGLYLILLGRDCKPTIPQPLFFPATHNGSNALLNYTKLLPNNTFVLGVTSGHMLQSNFLYRVRESLKQFLPLTDDQLIATNAFAFVSLKGKMFTGKWTTNILKLTAGWEQTITFGELDLWYQQ